MYEACSFPRLSLTASLRLSHLWSSYLKSLLWLQLSHTLHASLYNNSDIITSTCPDPLSPSIDSQLNPQETQMEVLLYNNYILKESDHIEQDLCLLWVSISCYELLLTRILFWECGEGSRNIVNICISMTKFPQPLLEFQTYIRPLRDFFTN